VGLDFNAFQRQKEMAKRESKKKLFISFVSENDVNFEYVKNVYQAFLDLDKNKKLGDRLKFEDFCVVCAVEPIAEYRRLHGLFDNENTGIASVHY
jgi:hypothetical protein